MADLVLYSALLGAFMMLLVTIHSKFLPTLKAGVNTRIEELKEEASINYGSTTGNPESILSIALYATRIREIETIHSAARVLVKMSLGLAIITLVIQFTVSFVGILPNGIEFLDIVLAVSVILCVAGILPPFLKWYD